MKPLLLSPLRHSSTDAFFPSRFHLKTHTRRVQTTTRINSITRIHSPFSTPALLSPSRSTASPWCDSVPFTGVSNQLPASVHNTIQNATHFENLTQSWSHNASLCFEISHCHRAIAEIQGDRLFPFHSCCCSSHALLSQSLLRHLYSRTLSGISIDTFIVNHSTHKNTAHISSEYVTVCVNPAV